MRLYSFRFIYMTGYAGSRDLVGTPQSQIVRNPHGVFARGSESIFSVGYIICVRSSTETAESLRNPETRRTPPGPSYVLLYNHNELMHIKKTVTNICKWKIIQLTNWLKPVGKGYRYSYSHKRNIPSLHTSSWGDYGGWGLNGTAIKKNTFLRLPLCHIKKLSIHKQLILFSI